MNGTCLRRSTLAAVAVVGALAVAAVPSFGGGVPRDAPGSRAMLPGEPLDFEQRCADPNVVLCDPLDTGRVKGVAVTGRTPNATLPEALAGKYRDWRSCHVFRGPHAVTPDMDAKVKASGTGALRFTIRSNSGAADGGSCQVNFTPDNSVQFGEEDTFFVQFRVRFSCDLLFTDCRPDSPEYKKQRRTFVAKNGRPTAFKVSILTAGDHKDLEFPVSSCSPEELVLVDSGRGVIGGYHACGWYDGHTRGLKLHRASGRSFQDLQPRQASGSDDTTCYNIDPASGQPLTSAWRGCVLWSADEWMTVTQQVTVGRWVEKVGDPARSSTVRVWVAREGQKPILVIDHARNLRRPQKPFLKYGKVWLLPYMTNKDPNETHPDAYMWFDELIVSRAPIAPAR